MLFFFKLIVVTKEYTSNLIHKHNLLPTLYWKKLHNEAK